MSNSYEIRINARLTGEDARRFQELQKLEKQSASYVLREAVREYHVKRIKPRRSAYEIMQESGMIGRFSGDPDSSSEESIKRAMGEVLRAKYPHHVKDSEPTAKPRRARKTP